MTRALLFAGAAAAWLSALVWIGFAVVLVRAPRRPVLSYLVALAIMWAVVFVALQAYYH